MDYNLSNYKHLFFINILSVKSFHTEKQSWGSIQYNFTGIGIIKVIETIPSFMEKLPRFSYPSGTNTMSFNPERDVNIMLELENILMKNSFYYDPTWNHQIAWKGNIIIYNKGESSYELLSK